MDQLKRAVENSLFTYVKHQPNKSAESNPDIQIENEDQQTFLQNSVNTLKKRLEKERQIHKEDNINIMNDNIQLIGTINHLRIEVND